MANERVRFYLWAGAALLAGLLLRLWFVAHQPQIAGDTFLYGDIAKNWARHGVYGFTDDPGPPRPTLIRLPGYPLFLMACFRLFGSEQYRAVLYVQTATDLATCLLLAGTARRLFGRPSLLPVLWLAAVCPFTAGYAAGVLTETLSLFCMAAAFYGLVRWRNAGLGLNRWVWLTGAALSYALLLRPEEGMLAAAILPAMFGMEGAAKKRVPQVSTLRPGAPHNRLGIGTPAVLAAIPAVAAALCVILPLLPWTLRNERIFHVFEPLVPKYANDPGEMAPLGFGRWYRTWNIDFASTVEAWWNYNGDRIEIEDIPPRAFGAGCTAGSQPLYGATAALLADYNRTMTATPAIDARFAALAAQRIPANPLCFYVALPLARLLDMTLRPRTEMMPIPLEWWRWREHRGQTEFATAWAALNLGYFILGIAGFAAWRRRGWAGSREIALATAATILLRCALLLTLDNAEQRYTLEFFPMLIVWAGASFRDQGAFASPTHPKRAS